MVNIIAYRHMYIVWSRSIDFALLLCNCDHESQSFKIIYSTSTVLVDITQSTFLGHKSQEALAKYTYLLINTINEKI